MDLLCRILTYYVDGSHLENNSSSVEFIEITLMQLNVNDELVVLIHSHVWKSYRHCNSSH